MIDVFSTFLQDSPVHTACHVAVAALKTCWQYRTVAGPNHSN